MSTKTDEEILTEFNKTFRGCDQCQYGDGQGEWIERWLRTLITTLRKEQEEAVIKAFKEGQEDGAVNRGERRRIIEQLRTEVQEESYTKGYNAGLADGTGKPLLAIEQIREEAVAEAKRKHGAEKFIDGMVAATQWLIDNKHIAAGSELNRMMLAAIAPQNTKTDTTNNDKRDEDQHREQCEGRY